MKIGWFLHTPFPASEIYVTLPMRKEILRGVLAANLIGFQIYDYVRHFMTACARVLGAVCLLLCPVVVVPCCCCACAWQKSSASPRHSARASG